MPSGRPANSFAKCLTDGSDGIITKADKNLRVKRLWVVGKNQNVLRLTLVSGGSRQIAGVLFGGMEEFMDYVREQFGEDALTDALHGRENAIRLSIVYSTKLDTYRDTESLQFVISSYR